MLRRKEAMATIAVRRLAAARAFYEDKLGFQPEVGEERGVVGYQSGSSTVLVYESPHAGTNQATAATWIVGSELDAIVRELKGKGIAFELYDLPGTTREGEIHVAGKMRAAWFKDPDGNILALVNG